MNFRFLALALGGVLLLMGALMLGCCAFSSWIDLPEHPGVPSAWIISTSVTLSASCVLLWVGRAADRWRIFQREAFAVVALGWVLAGGFGALPLALAPVPAKVYGGTENVTLRATPWDALFESYSGLTTTGATVIDDLESLPMSLNLWRAMLQWIGGLGVVVLFVALLGFLGVGGKALFSKESSQLAEGGLTPRVRSLALSYLKIYLTLSLIAFSGLLVLGLGPFDALCHTMALVSTGGFSPYSASVEHFNNLLVYLWMALVMLAAATSFALHYQVFLLGRWKAWQHNDELRLFLIIVVVATGLIALDLWVRGVMAQDGVIRTWVNAFFQTVSIVTTTGFSSTDFGQWPTLAQTVLLVLMVVGGCAGSTAGGMKVGRIQVFAKAMIRHLRQSYRPHLVLKVHLNGRTVDEGRVTGVIAWVGLYFFVWVIAAGILSVMEPNLDSFASVFSATLSCLSNVGPGMEQVGPSHHCGFFSPWSKLWLSFLMVLGRLELVALLVVLIPGFWRRF